jgi:hypothetical protein
MDYGARIERGVIVSRDDEGFYAVRSITREGITVPAIGAIFDEVYEPETVVYFFVFGDGEGKIIAAC